MKKIFSMMVLLLLVCSTAFGKGIKTLVFTTTPQMHCENCEKKIKNNVRFVKGTKSIETDVARQRVTIVCDADKAKEADYLKAFEKIGYKATVVETKVAPAKQKARPDATTSASEQH